MASYNTITEKEKELIQSKKYTIKELSNLTGRHYGTIRKWSKILNIEQPHPKAKRKYLLNEKYFNFINKESAYLLGFIFADGCISKSRKSYILSIALQYRDIEILNKFQKCFESNYPIRIKTINNRKYCYLSVCSKELCENLIKLGAVQNKTFRLKLPNIPKEFVIDFIRGYFDGDGCIRTLSCKNSPNENLAIQFSGQYDFLKEIKDFLNKEMNKNYGCLVKVKNQNCSILRFSGIKSSLSLAKLIYNNSTFTTRLERKHNIYYDFEKKYNHKLSEKRTKPKIENSHNHNKLNWSQVKEIRSQLILGIKKQIIANQYKVHFKTIDSIQKNKIWKLEHSDFYEKKYAN